jgi:hypothetical protein
MVPATETDTSTPIGAAENAGDIRSRDLSTFLFPKAFLFNGKISNCCVMGFHTYDLESGGPTNGFSEKRYDLFVNNATPWWLAPNKLCQNNLETGDVIEGLPNSQFPIVLNGATWRPQNEALLQMMSKKLFCR